MRILRIHFKASPPPSDPGPQAVRIFLELDAIDDPNDIAVLRDFMMSRADFSIVRTVTNE